MAVRPKRADPELRRRDHWTGISGGLSRWMSSLLFGIAPVDPLTYLASGALIGAAAMTASYVPARQAASVDPMETLRSE